MSRSAVRTRDPSRVIDVESQHPRIPLSMVGGKQAGGSTSGASASGAAMNRGAGDCVPAKVHPSSHACPCLHLPSSLLEADAAHYASVADLTAAEAERRNGTDTGARFILTGYRTNHSVFDCFRSVFALHNETFNIWTHLAGFLYWSWVFSTLDTQPWFQGIDELSQAVTKVGYGICLLMPLSSATYHTFSDAQSCCCFRAGPSSDKWSVANVFLRMDLFGIYSLFYARSLMEGYLALYCYRQGWIAFQMVSLIVFAVLAPVGLWTTKLWPLVPSFILVHVPILVIVCTTQWWSSPGLTLHVLFSLAGTGCFVVAFAVYRRRWPESRWPGQFDIVGASHQIWHIFTFLGPELIMIGMRYHFAHLRDQPCFAKETSGGFFRGEGMLHELGAGGEAVHLTSASGAPVSGLHDGP